MILEVLASSIVIMTIFISIYACMLPTIAQYQNREKYTSIDATYKSYFTRKIFLKDYDVTKNIDLGSDGYLVLYDETCNISDNLKEDCNRYISALNIKKAILIKSLSDVNYNDDDLKDYISYLSDDDIYLDTYRLIIKTNDNFYASSQFLLENSKYSLKVINNFDYEINIQNDTTGDNYTVLANNEILIDTNYEDSFNFNYEANFNDIDVSKNIIILDLNNKLVIGSDL